MNRPFWIGPGAAHRRVIYRGAGYSDDDIQQKPHIGVANAYAASSPAHAHLRLLAEAAMQGIWEAGGLPFEFGVPSTCGNVAIGTEELKYDMAGRDAVAMAVELVAKVHHFDGLVLLSTCDNIVPGQLLAAARLDIPSVLVTGGPMMPGCWQGRAVLTPDVNVSVLSDLDPEDSAGLEAAACPGYGACGVMGTANTMQILSEVLGLALLGTSTIPAVAADRLRAARSSGRSVVEALRREARPSDLITRASLLNAVAVDLAIGGSTNAVLHLLALARELDLQLALDDFDRLSRAIPCICAVRPNGPYSVVDLHEAGGVPALLNVLQHELDLSASNVSGRSLSEVISSTRHEQTGPVIRPFDDPVHPDGGLAVLYGNLAPDGAVVRTSGVPAGMRSFSGPARVFNGDAAALAAVEDGVIRPGDVMVVRHEGPKGAPGMKEVMLATDALVARGLDRSVGLVTDGRFSGFNHGPIVGHVSPESFDGGPIALVRDGDEITVDIPGRRLEVALSPDELSGRRTGWTQPPAKTGRGMLALYAATCRPAHEGAAMQTW